MYNICAIAVYKKLLIFIVSGSVMVGVVMLSRKFHINPDNVATPVAASLGDLTTVSMLAAVSMVLFKTLGMCWFLLLQWCLQVVNTYFYELTHTCFCD